MCGLRDGVCLELSVPAWEVAWLSVTCEHVPGTPLPAGLSGASRRGSCPFWLREFLAQKGDRGEAILPQRTLGDIV